MQHPMLTQVEIRLAQALAAMDGTRGLAVPEGLGFQPGQEIDWRLHHGRFQVHCQHRQSPVFHKIHLERGEVAGGFHYFHAMWFPSPRYSLPLMGVDVNAAAQRVTLAVLHLYPALADDPLPAPCQQALDGLAGLDFARHRPLPAWGDIFQEGLCFIVQPQDDAEQASFAALVAALAPAYLRQARVAVPEAVAAPATRARWQRQAHYVARKRANDRGRRLLAANLPSAALADRYVDEFLWPDPAPLESFESPDGGAL